MGLDSCEDGRPTGVAGASEIVGRSGIVPGKRREHLPPDLVLHSAWRVVKVSLQLFFFIHS